MKALRGCPSGILRGAVKVGGDKSLSHRAVMLAGVSVGASVLRGLSGGEDVEATISMMQKLGVPMGWQEGALHVEGVGWGGLQSPKVPLDAGNAGTGARLLLGLLAVHPLTAVVCGDASLSARPMGRVMRPLSVLGAKFTARGGENLPVMVEGAARAPGWSWKLNVASAQVKSALLLAGLGCEGQVEVEEPQASRDHTENLLKVFGVEVVREGLKVRVQGGMGWDLRGSEVHIPGDASSAALVVAAMAGEGCEVVVEGVGLNPLRLGFYEVLQEMGVEVEIEVLGEAAGEPVGRITVKGGELKGVHVGRGRAAGMIDEYPALAMVAARAHGETRMEGVGELRVKESDRLALVVEGLQANGVEAWVEEKEGEVLVVRGCGGAPRGGGRVEAALDHRVAMAFLVLGLGSEQGVEVMGEDVEGVIATSFPNFRSVMEGLGARFAEV